MEIEKDRVKIEKYPDGYVIFIKEKNWKKEGNFMTPCIIHYKGFDYQLDNDFIIKFKNENKETIRGKDMIRFLPSLLEHGTMVPFRETKFVKRYAHAHPNKVNFIGELEYN